MNIKNDFTVLRVKHYKMDNNQGASVILLTDPTADNNQFGLGTPEADIPYEEVVKLQTMSADRFPAVFEANMSMQVKKSKGNKEMPVITLANLKYKHSLDLSPRK